MIKKWLEIINDHRISLHERMFRIVTAISMIAVLFTMPMGRNIWGIVLMVAALVAIALIVKYSIRRGRIQAGATAIVLLLLSLFPITFFPQAAFTAACRSGLSFALSMSASPCREGGCLCFLAYAQRKR